MDGFKLALTYLSLLFQVIKRKRSPGPSLLSHFYAQGKNTTLINIEKTIVSSNFMTQSLSGLKCTLASFFKPSHRCGGEIRKIELFELPTFLASLFSGSG